MVTTPHVNARLAVFGPKGNDAYLAGCGLRPLALRLGGGVERGVDSRDRGCYDQEATRKSMKVLFLLAPEEKRNAPAPAEMEAAGPWVRS